MRSTFTGIEIAKRSLMAHTQGLATVGHNLSNASTEGYSRQRVEMRPFDPIYMPGLNREERAGQMGQGAVVDRIERVHDRLLEGRIVSQGSGRGYWDTRSNYLLMVEQVYNEPGDYSVRAQMDRFWDSWQELSLHPEETASRQAVIQRGLSLIDSIHRRYEGLKEIRDIVEEDIVITTGRVNGILRDIAELNEQIVKIRAVGDNPNDLLDRRDLLTRELSEIISITVDDRDHDEFTIHTGGMHLVQGRKVNYLEARPEPENDGYSRIVWRKEGDDVRLLGQGGRLASLLELRDGDLREEIQNFDMMTLNFIDLVNENHRAGYGLNKKTGTDFFSEYPRVLNAQGNYDSNGDGAFDSTYIFRMTGGNVINAQEQLGLQGTLRFSGRGGIVEIDYHPADTTESLIRRINTSGSEIVARLNRDGKLSLKALPASSMGNPDFVIRHLEDSGQFLTGYSGILAASGEEGAYTSELADAVRFLRQDAVDFAVAPLAHPSGWIEVNRSIVNDPSAIAAGFGHNGKPASSGDSSAAVAIASLRNSKVTVGRHPDFDEYFSSSVAKIGLKGEAAERALETENLIMKELHDMRDSLVGVNLDEELSQMIKFQHGYNAAARFVSEWNKMLDTIINRLGV